MRRIETIDVETEGWKLTFPEAGNNPDSDWEYWQDFSEADKVSIANRYGTTVQFIEDIESNLHSLKDRVVEDMGDLFRQFEELKKACGK